MAKTILIDHGKRKELMRSFNCCYRTVRQALNYETDTECARKIRTRAKKMGGIEYEN